MDEQQQYEAEQGAYEEDQQRQADADGQAQYQAELDAGMAEMEAKEQEKIRQNGLSVTPPVQE
jgi:hypothetical protein